MKKQKMLIWSTVLLFTLMQITVQQRHVEQQIDGGVWSNVMTPEINVGPSPPRMMLCGFRFHLKTYEVNLWNCNCGTRWYRWRRQYRCNWCPNYFQTMTSAFTGTFCSISNWNEQSSLSVNSGDAINGSYTQTFMCPQGHYANGFVSSFGVQNGIQLGFNGLGLKCSKLDSSDRKDVVFTTSAAWREWNYPKIGQFITSFQVKYDPNGKLTGFAVDYYPIPVISNITITYDIPKDPNWSPQIISQREISNGGSQIVVQNIGFAEKFQQKFSYTTSRTDITGFSIGASAKFQLPSFQGQINTSFYQSTEVKVQFNKEVSKTWESTRNLTILIPPNSIVTISQIFYANTMNIPFTAELTYASATTGEVLRTETIQGVWKGVAIQKEVTSIKQKPLIA